MESLLNRGLNFAITPLKLNLSQVICDFKKFERTALWQEYWANYPQTDYNPPIFKKRKTNLPTKHPTPQGLKVFLNAVKSEISDIKGLNKTRPNLPPEEQRALHQLIKLQRERVITIKPCDKGAGIILLDFEAYLKSCTEHLSSVQKQPDGTTKPFYQQVEPEILDIAKKKILDVLKDALENEYISKDEFEAMDPTDNETRKVL